MLFYNELNLHLINNELFGDSRSYVFFAHDFGCALFYFLRIGVIQDDDILRPKDLLLIAHERKYCHEKSNMYDDGFCNHVDMLYGGLCGDVNTQNQR